MKTKMRRDWGWARVDRADNCLWFTGIVEHAAVYLTRRAARSVQDPGERIVRMEIRDLRKAAKR